MRVFANCSKNQIKARWVLGFTKYWGIGKKKIPHGWGNTRTLKCTICKSAHIRLGSPHFREANEKCISCFIDIESWLILITAPLLFQVFTKRVHELKQFANLRVHDENILWCLINSSTKWGGRGALILNFGKKERWLIEGGANNYWRIMVSWNHLFPTRENFIQSFHANFLQVFYMISLAKKISHTIFSLEMFNTDFSCKITGTTFLFVT